MLLNNYIYQKINHQNFQLNKSFFTSLNYNLKRNFIYHLLYIFNHF